MAIESGNGEDAKTTTSKLSVQLRAMFSGMPYSNFQLSSDGQNRVVHPWKFVSNARVISSDNSTSHPAPDAHFASCAGILAKFTVATISRECGPSLAKDLIWNTDRSSKARAFLIRASESSLDDPAGMPLTRNVV